MLIGHAESALPHTPKIGLPPYFGVVASKTRNDETVIIFDMLEPVIAVVATVVLVFVANIVHAFYEERGGLWDIFLYAFVGGGVLYCVVRFIHWAWVTPMPFVSQ